MSGWAQREAEDAERRALAEAREDEELRATLAGQKAERVELRLRLAELEALALTSDLRRQYGTRSLRYRRPKGGPVDRLCGAAHDLANRYLPVVEAQELLVTRLGAEEPSRNGLRRVVALCDREGWLDARRRALRAELDQFDAAMDSALAAARALLAEEGDR